MWHCIVSEGLFTASVIYDQLLVASGPAEIFVLISVDAHFIIKHLVVTQSLYVC